MTFDSWNLKMFPCVNWIKSKGFANKLFLEGRDNLFCLIVWHYHNEKKLEYVNRNGVFVVNSRRASKSDVPCSTF